ncbi:MAG: RNA methyltransferase [Pseudomonadota bacterium]
MSGTDSSNTPLAGGGPAIILIKPQLGENIGACARAMLNCGLDDLRLVQPRDGWPDIKAERAASGADRVLEKVRLYDTTQDAIADLTRVYATTARVRHMIKTEMEPRQAVSDMRQTSPDGAGIGILFGAERSGMDNDDVALADVVVMAPLNPAFSSLNLAQAVLLVAYEWRMAQLAEPEARMGGRAGEAASKEVLLNFFDHIERALDTAHFFTAPDKKPSMIRNIRNLFGRASLREQEVKMLHGIVTALSDLRRDGRARHIPAERGPTNPNKDDAA